MRRVEDERVTLLECPIVATNLERLRSVNQCGPVLGSDLQDVLTG
jgi:hypothetical protein